MTRSETARGNEGACHSSRGSPRIRSERQETEQRMPGQQRAVQGGAGGEAVDDALPRPHGAGRAARADRRLRRADVAHAGEGAAARRGMGARDPVRGSACRGAVRAEPPRPLRRGRQCDDEAPRRASPMPCGGCRSTASCSTASSSSRMRKGGATRRRSPATSPTAGRTGWSTTSSISSISTASTSPTRRSASGSGC